ncbi:MAG TPA: glycerol acyltransferase, partial [Burkholderiales bacterium]|nr:glycerol acyltransferase [Burkholderiales bacterium]
VVPMALSGLWQSLFARNPGKFKRMRGLFPKIRLAVGEPVAAAAATPEHLHDVVLGLRGEWR